MMVAALLFSTACDDQLDINEDPLAATQVDPNLLMPEVLVNLSNIRESELDARIGSIVQYYEGVFGVFNSMSLADLSNTFLMGNVWANIYTNGLKNLALIERTALENEPGTSDNVIAQARLMKAFCFWQLTMLWEDVPYLQAADFTTALPEYDSQETILRGLIGDINDAVALIDDDSQAIENGDLLYGGDMDLWRRFGNSLKLKILMDIANVDPGSVSGEIASTINAPLIEELGQEASLKYLDSPGNFNPFWNILERFAGGDNPTWYIASEVPFNILQDMNDPRLSAFYEEGDRPEVKGTGDFGVPATPGSFGTSDTNSIVSLVVIRPDRPDRYLIASETLLLKAEAVQRGFGEGDADALYRQGISASIDFFDGTAAEISEDDEEAFLATLPDLGTLSEQEALDAIALQLYFANFERMPDGWEQWRRTKIPALDAPSNSQVTGVTRRFFYPPDEVGANPNAPDSQPLDNPMWYENE